MQEETNYVLLRSKITKLIGYLLPKNAGMISNKFFLVCSILFLQHVIITSTRRLEACGKGINDQKFADAVNVPKNDTWLKWGRFYAYCMNVSLYYRIDNIKTVNTHYLK